MAGEIHITVATAWVGGRTNLDVEHETHLVKAALLYADRVTLASPRVAMLASIAGLLVLDERDRGAAVLEMVQALPQGREIKEQIDRLRGQKHKTLDQIFRLRDLERDLRSSGAEMTEHVETILNEAGVEELGKAIAAGALDLDGLGINEPKGIDRIAYRVSDLLAAMVAPDSTTYPLLDESTNGLLKAMVKEGVVRSDAGSGTVEPTLAASWIGGVPAFPDAAMDAILEAREELRAPLVGFRSAVVGITKGLGATPLDDEWTRTAEEAFREKVAPALEELNYLGEESKVFPLLRRSTIGSTRQIAAAALGLVGAGATSLPAILGAGLGVTADIAGQALERRRDLGDQKRENAFLFLYEVDERLGG
jgi:hypothetical protein